MAGAELTFKLLSESAMLPTRVHPGDAGVDLYAAGAARLGPGERTKVGTGVAVAIPEGHAGLVLPRSGLAERSGIALVNAPGLIDSGYRGEIAVLLLNTDREQPFIVETGARIAQLLLVPFAGTEPVEVTELEGTDRGEGGFGSTGE